jgi:hypothetical protein
MNLEKDFSSIILEAEHRKENIRVGFVIQTTPTKENPVYTGYIVAALVLNHEENTRWASLGVHTLLGATFDAEVCLGDNQITVTGGLFF